MKKMKNLLLLSNSKTQGYEWLEHADDWFKDLYSDVKKITFVPYAAVTYSWDEYRDRAMKYFARLGLKVESVHDYNDHTAAIDNAEAIAVGGGNTFHLLKLCYNADLILAIRNRVRIGVPYAGWSAGSNLACPTISTTNDMPIVEPPKFIALDIVPFQINPHYTDAVIENHFGETRQQRIEEFTIANPNINVLALREGSAVRVINNDHTLLGELDSISFRYGKEPRITKPGESLDFLL